MVLMYVFYLVLQHFLFAIIPGEQIVIVMSLLVIRLGQRRGDI